MKRPGIVWLYTILVVLGMLSTIGSGMSTLTSSRSQVIPSYEKYAIFASFVLLIPQIIFIFLFLTLKRSSIVCLYISFGLGFILNLITRNWIIAGLTAIFGWVVWDYISHKKIEGEHIFK